MVASKLPDRVTSLEERKQLAQRHRQSLVRSALPTCRQNLRLRILRTVGRSYGRTCDSAWRQGSPTNILVIRPDHLGDLLFSTPALHLLRTRFPAARLTALVGPWGEGVLAGSQDLDQILTCSFPGFTRRRRGSLLAPYRLLAQEADRLRRGQFDWALTLRYDHWWGAWLAAAAGVPCRLGYDVPETRPFLTYAAPYRPGRHEVTQNLALVLAAISQSGLSPAAAADPRDPTHWPLRFPLSAADQAAAQALLASLGDDPLVAIHPGSGAAVKQWRREGWAALIAALVKRHSARVIVTGSAAEVDLVEAIVASLAPGVLPRVVSLAGRTSLGVLAAVYQRCRLVIGPDCGPLHLAVAVGTPTLHLYGPVDEATFGPWGDGRRHRVLVSDWACMPCNRLDWPNADLPAHGCVRDIDHRDVLREADRLLAQGMVGRPA